MPDSGAAGLADDPDSTGIDTRLIAELPISPPNANFGSFISFSAAMNDDPGSVAHAVSVIVREIKREEYRRLVRNLGAVADRRARVAKRHAYFITGHTRV